MTIRVVKRTLKLGKTLAPSVTYLFDGRRCLGYVGLDMGKIWMPTMFSVSRTEKRVIIGGGV